MDVDDRRFISSFIIQALKGQDITVYVDGKQTRSFQYVDDLVNGMIQMMNTHDEYTEPVNIGNPEEYKMQELVQFILELINSSSKHVFFLYLKMTQREDDQILNWLEKN